MAKLKSFIKHVFESKWTYNDEEMIRVHKETGKVQYRDWDDWGFFWVDSQV